MCGLSPPMTLGTIHLSCGNEKRVFVGQINKMDAFFIP